MKLQKPISLILALVLLFSMIPMQAAAATLAEPSAGSPVVKGESSVGAILGEAAQRNKQTENTSESISDVTVSGRTATVTLLHTKSCMVVVGIYDETGKTLLQTAQKRDIAADAETAELTFDSDLPEHYTLRAFILDENCAPLGKAFETDRYTSAYEEFLGKTTADFPAEDVINFDNSANNNFAVYDSAVKEISTDGKNTPTIGENGYTFTDADDSLLTLAAGDIFTFNNNGTPEIVKVASVSVSGATVTVTPADAQMEEVFDYVKIDVTADQASLDMSSADDGVSYAPQNDDSVGAGADYELLRHFTLNIERGGIEGELDMTATLHFKLYYSGGILETELTDEVSGELDVSVGAKYEGSFRLCKLHFPTPVAGLMIAVEVAFAPEVSAKFNGKVEYSQKVGCAYSSKSGFRNLSQKPQLDAEVNFEGTVFIGFTVTPSIEALFGVVELGLECKLGAEGTGTRVLTTTDSKESDHLCRWCIDGTISGKAEISVELETGFWKKWKHTLKAKLLDWEKELFDFYYSANKGFGKGECPNRKEPVDNPYYFTDTYSPMELDWEYREGGNGYTISYHWENKHVDIYVSGSGNAEIDPMWDLQWYVSDIYNRVWDWAMRSYVYDKAREYVDEYMKKYEYDTASFYFSGFTGIETCMYVESRDIHFSKGTKVVKIHGDEEGKLQTLDLPDSVEEIFLDDASHLSNLTLPPHVKYLYGFNNYRASTLTLPSSVRRAEGFNHSSITNLNLSTPDVNLVLDGFTGCPLESLTVPERVFLRFFEPFERLKNVTVSSGIHISGCSNLEEITFDDQMEKIDVWSCNNNGKLKKVNFGSSITSIGIEAFEESGMDTITIPYTIKTIQRGAFKSCPNLREVIVEDGVKEIGAEAFAGCKNLERIVLPSSLSYLDKDAFKDCNPGIELYFGGEPWQWWNLTAEYNLSADNVPTARKMFDIEFDASIFMNCTIYLNSDGTKQLRTETGNEPVGANTANGYANAEYLIAVEDAENGKLGGTVRMLAQVQADGNGKVTVPDDIAAGEGEYLNLYGACRHPSAHLTEDNKYICDICTERLPAVIDLGKRPDDSGITTGDVNGDGAITITDVTEIQRHLAGLTQLSNQALARADTNGDGKVDIADATHLQKYLARYNVALGKQAA